MNWLKTLMILRKGFICFFAFLFCFILVLTWLIVSCCVVVFLLLLLLSSLFKQFQTLISIDFILILLEKQHYKIRRLFSQMTFQRKKKKKKKIVIELTEFIFLIIEKYMKMIKIRNYAALSSLFLYHKYPQTWFSLFLIFLGI